MQYIVPVPDPASPPTPSPSPRTHCDPDSCPLEVDQDQELGYGFMLEIAGHDGIQESALTLLVLYIRKSREIQPRVSWGLDPKRGALSQSATCTRACQTYFPWPWTRHVDPRSILRDQNKRLNRATRVGM